MSDNPLTDTSTFARVETGKIPALRVTKQGVQSQNQVAAINPGASLMLSQGALPTTEFTEVGCSQLVVFPAGVGGEEVEALAVSLWEDAAWIAPGRLRLSGQAQLCGPFSLNQENRKILQLPSGCGIAFRLDCPRQRAGALAPELQGADSLTDAFAASEPIGLEYEVLNGLLAICRRLGGSLRIGPGNRAKDSSAELLSPDPDSAVNLTVYSPYWIEIEQLKSLLNPVLGELSLDGEQLKEPTRRVERANREAEELVKAQLGEKELQRIAAEAAAFDKEVGFDLRNSEAYALYGSVGKGADFCVGVQTSLQLPSSLRFHPHQGQPFASYQLQWLSEPMGRRRLSRIERVARLKVINAFEDAARLLARISDGSVVDDDSFLITWT